MASCLLFHGPGARATALERAHVTGRLLADPIGDEGLGVDEAREAVRLLQMTPVGMDKGVVVIGPMDRLRSFDANDALLKHIEEFEDRFVQPILWAHDYGGVSETIRSRCLDFWSPLDEAIEEDDDFYVSAGWDLLHVTLNEEYWRFQEVLDRFKGKKDWEHRLLSYLIEALRQDITLSGDPEPRMELWKRLRPVTKYQNPTSIEILAALLPCI
jgi:hypothetical protein